jgi:23S rRNA pseudouridine2605 synthase
MPLPSKSRRAKPSNSRFAPGHVALQRALSKLGLASRTQARELILAGRVKVNGTVRKHPQYSVQPEKARIEIDGQQTERAEKRVFILHKPKGVVTTRSDEKGRPTVFTLPAVVELLKANPGLALHAVGRLDQATTGLLILTNDTRLSSWLTDPESGVSRVYLVSVRGEVTEEKLRQLEKGIRDDGETLQADRATLRKASGRESHLTLELKQGKNREIRRILAALGHEVTKLKRVSYGELPEEARDVNRQ